jgi:hypothetical protein
MPSESIGGSGLFRLRFLNGMQGSSQGRNFFASICFDSLNAHDRTKGSGSG